ncbi:hypothetical protein E4U56_007111 [Claviceps arundinis]|uniref:Uncharacterized protein n=1 Tax=Claviceps arundinis TaxID=1623583 RepID=A0A9P7MWS7_9HYPO|nr:hypothetical protein E4U56_007111 [Claviceps arundinis]
MPDSIHFITRRLSQYSCGSDHLFPGKRVQGLTSSSSRGTWTYAVQVGGRCFGNRGSDQVPVGVPLDTFATSYDLLNHGPWS